MPTIDANREFWNKSYEWPKEGEEWSRAFGGSDMQWYASILPRIHAFIPTRRILEIAPGFGRWTHYLKDWCQHLVVVDISEKCIHACRDRFSAYPHITAHMNDGRSLDMIEDDSLNFVFSFDSLVHADDLTMSAYVSQLAAKLRDDGVAFLHHSNLGEYSPEALEETGEPTHGRASSMTAEKIRSFTVNSGMVCVSQELIPWGTDEALIDCISILAKPAIAWTLETEIFKNTKFMSETNYISKLSHIYGLQRIRR